MKIQGKITHIEQPLSGTSSNGTWAKQLFVIETFGDYPKSLAFQVWNNDLGMLKNLQDRTPVEVHFRIQSRVFEDRWYTELTAYKINVL